MNEKVNLASKFQSFSETWVPKVVGELNDQFVKVAKFKGEYVWHSHEHEDEMFLVISGRLRILLRDQEVVLEEGEFFIVPRGIEHKPVADDLVEAMLFEPCATRNTGSVDHGYTIEPGDLESI